MTDPEAEELGRRYAQAVEKEVEPLLQDARPFFGGSERLTMAEVRNFMLNVESYSLFFITGGLDYC
jgi:glutathione S-transferase